MPSRKQFPKVSKPSVRQTLMELDRALPAGEFPPALEYPMIGNSNVREAVDKLLTGEFVVINRRMLRRIIEELG